MKNNKISIVLASSSPRRKQLLSYLVYDFKIVPSNLDEEKFLKLARNPEELAVKLAAAKAKEIDSRENSPEDTNVIIAADTIVVLQKQGKWLILGKPKNEFEAKEILTKLRSNTHQVITGLCLINSKTKRLLTDFVVSQVTFGQFSDEVLDGYVKTGSPLDKAGGYGIQEIKVEFMVEFEGSITNIIGLPVKRLAEMLESFGVKLKPNWNEKVKETVGYEE